MEGGHNADVGQLDTSHVVSPGRRGNGPPQGLLNDQGKREMASGAPPTRRPTRSRGNLRGLNGHSSEKTLGEQIIRAEIWCIRPPAVRCEQPQRTENKS